MVRVLVESPFAGNEEFTEAENIAYARKCCNDCLLKNEAPYASHLFYTQEGLLNDDVPEERELGINAGLLWGEVSDKSVVYVDRGISQGMKYGIENAIKHKRLIEVRTIEGNEALKLKTEAYINEVKSNMKSKTHKKTTHKKSKKINSL